MGLLTSLLLSSNPVCLSEKHSVQHRVHCSAAGNTELCLCPGQTAPRGAEGTLCSSDPNSCFLHAGTLPKQLSLTQPAAAHSFHFSNLFSNTQLTSIWYFCFTHTQTPGFLRSRPRGQNSRLRIEHNYHTAVPKWSLELERRNHCKWGRTLAPGLWQEDLPGLDKT